MYDLCLYQINHIRNKKDKLLDLVFSTSLSISINSHHPFVLPEDLYHPTVMVTLNILNSDVPNDNTSNTLSKIYNFSRTNFNVLREALSQSNWSDSCDLDTRLTFIVLSLIVSLYLSLK